MNKTKELCAPENRNLHTLWSEIDWTRAEMYVQKLQARVVKAQREGRHNKVKALQWTLTHSFYAKALAVKRVTTNKGKDTVGVDKAVWSSPLAKAKAIGSLKRRGYQPQPLRRVNIEKKNGKLRPLGIPTMKDRAMQALYLMALDPIAETTGDTHSYGFRKHRCIHDAIEQCFILLSRTCAPEWILEGETSKAASTTSATSGFSTMSQQTRRYYENGSNAGSYSMANFSPRKRVRHKEASFRRPSQTWLLTAYNRFWKIVSENIR